MTRALELGCNFFDAAEVYADGKAEEVMGRWVKQIEADGKARRSDLVIST
jgi:aryl-alcohol dehydrogenase-like predicted oxidoreductase